MELLSRNEADELVQLFQEPSEVDKAHQLLNILLSRVFNKAIETTLLSLPDTITYLLEHHAERMRCLKEAAKAVAPAQREDFARLVEMTELAHPTWPYEKILAEAVAGLSQAKAETTALSLAGLDLAINGVLDE